MKPKTVYPRAFFLIIAAMIVLAGLAAAVVDMANESRSRLPVWGQVPEFQFTTQIGRPFGTADMIGRLHVVDFIFTNCQSVCPVLASRFGELYRLYEGSDKVRLVSISVDPDRDSPAALQAYAALQGVTDDRWVFLRAPIEEVITLCESGFMLAAENLPMGHTSKMILVDEQGRIRSYHDGLDAGHLEVLKANIRQLARELP
jgi:protein SCO1/2